MTKEQCSGLTNCLLTAPLATKQVETGVVSRGTTLWHGILFIFIVTLFVVVGARGADLPPQEVVVSHPTWEEYNRERETSQTPPSCTIGNPSVDIQNVINYRVPTEYDPCSKTPLCDEWAQDSRVKMLTFLAGESPPYNLPTNCGRFPITSGFQLLRGSDLDEAVQDVLPGCLRRNRRQLTNIVAAAALQSKFQMAFGDPATLASTPWVSLIPRPGPKLEQFQVNASGIVPDIQAVLEAPLQPYSVNFSVNEEMYFQESDVAQCTFFRAASPLKKLLAGIRSGFTAFTLSILVYTKILTPLAMATWTRLARCCQNDKDRVKKKCHCEPRCWKPEPEKLISKAKELVLGIRSLAWSILAPKAPATRNSNSPPELWVHLFIYIMLVTAGVFLFVQELSEPPDQPREETVEHPTFATFAQRELSLTESGHLQRNFGRAGRHAFCGVGNSKINVSDGVFEFPISSTLQTFIESIPSLQLTPIANETWIAARELFQSYLTLQVANGLKFNGGSLSGPRDVSRVVNTTLISDINATFFPSQPFPRALITGAWFSVLTSQYPVNPPIPAHQLYLAMEQLFGHQFSTYLTALANVSHSWTFQASLEHMASSLQYMTSYEAYYNSSDVRFCVFFSDPSTSARFLRAVSVAYPFVSTSIKVLNMFFVLAHLMRRLFCSSKGAGDMEMTRRILEDSARDSESQATQTSARATRCQCDTCGFNKEVDQGSVLCELVQTSPFWPVAKTPTSSTNSWTWKEIMCVIASLMLLVTFFTVFGVVLGENGAPVLAYTSPPNLTDSTVHNGGDSESVCPTSHSSIQFSQFTMPRSEHEVAKDNASIVHFLNASYNVIPATVTDFGDLFLGLSIAHLVAENLQLYASLDILPWQTGGVIPRPSAVDEMEVWLSHQLRTLPVELTPDILGSFTADTIVQMQLQHQPLTRMQNASERVSAMIQFTQKQKHFTQVVDSLVDSIMSRVDYSLLLAASEPSHCLGPTRPTMLSRVSSALGVALTNTMMLLWLLSLIMACMIGDSTRR